MASTIALRTTILRLRDVIICRSKLKVGHAEHSPTFARVDDVVARFSSLNREKPDL
jgi:hypothetical protein